MLSRGFTQHEMLDSFCLVNMNARLYDPGLGLFLSADSVVPNPYDFTGFQRYSYLGNGPLNGTDPTGHMEGDPPRPIWPTDPFFMEEVPVYGSYCMVFYCGGRGGFDIGNGSGNFTGGGGGGGGGGSGSGDQNCPKAPGQTQCETVVVTGTHNNDPLTMADLGPLTLPRLNYPMQQFNFEGAGPSPRSCNRTLMTLGNNTRTAAYSISTAGVGALGLGGLAVAQGKPQGAALAVGGTTALTLGGFYDLLGAGFQSAASGDYDTVAGAAADVIFDTLIDQGLTSPYSELYDFGRGLQTALSGPTTQSCR